MQEKISANIPKRENIITLQGMEEERSIARKMWHSITETGGVESVKLQCSKSHTQSL